MESAAQANRLGDHRKAIQFNYKAVAYYRAAMHGNSYIARPAISYVYLGMLQDLIQIGAVSELRCALSEIAKNGTPEVQQGHSVWNKFYFMSASHDRLLQEYNAFLSEFESHGTGQVVDGKTIYGIQNASAGNNRIAQALRDGAYGKPAIGAKLLDRSLSILGADDFSMKQDFNYYSAWLHLAAGETKAATKRFYGVLLRGPSRPEMTADVDEIESARYLSTQPRANLDLLEPSVSR